jgi:hypothetical protein
MRVATLSAGAVENPRADRKLEDVDQARDFAPVAREVEEGLELEEVPGAEVRRPPLGGRRIEDGGWTSLFLLYPPSSILFPRQKNTGSRYAPKTSSSAARISYNVE